MAVLMSPVTGALDQIQTKVRRITGMLSVNQLSDNDLNGYINDFYQYDLPEHLRLWNTHGVYTLSLIPQQSEYAFPFNTWTSLEPPCYVDGYEIQLFQSLEEFYTTYPDQRRLETLATGTGIAGPYAGTLTGTPVTEGTVRLTVVDNAGNSLVATENGTGVFTGNVLAGSTINYTTGAIAGITWTGAIAAGTLIRAHYINWQTGRPQGVLFNEQRMVFYPVPDIAYEFRCSGFRNPAELAAASDEPRVRDWWTLIAYGASLKIFADNLDMESYAKVDILFDKQKRLVERRTLTQLKNQRAATIYSQHAVGVTPFNSNI